MSFRSILAALVLIATVLDVVVAVKDDFSRKVTMVHNPGCDIPECETGTNLIYAKAQGASDSLHYLLSTVGESSPTLLLLRTEEANATLTINWTNFIHSPIESIHGSVELISEQHGGKISADVKSVIIFDRLLEYNDSSDEANMPVNASDQFTPIMLKRLKWEVNMTDTHRSYIMGTSEKDPKSFAPNSSVSIDFMPFSDTGHSDVPPSLPHNANSSDWEVNLDALLSRGNGSRFGVELLLLGFDSGISKLRSKSINDEYSPSIFTTEQFEWSCPTSDASTGANTLTFHQWRAVSYSTMHHVRKMSADLKSSDFTDFNSTSSRFEEITSNRLLRAYFELKNLSSATMKSVILSFGEAQDGFYAATNYSSWTSTIGFSKPPADTFSILVICMLVTGVGCPLIVILLGGVYVTWVRVKRSKRGIRKQLVTNYEPIET